MNCDNCGTVLRGDKFCSYAGFSFCQETHGGDAVSQPSFSVCAKNFQDRLWRAEFTFRHGSPGEILRDLRQYIIDIMDRVDQSDYEAPVVAAWKAFDAEVKKTGIVIPSSS
jgi:hypothetical protein